MSIQAMVWAMEQQVVTDATARHVLLCLANFAGQDGADAFPAVDTLKKHTGLSERTIRYKLDLLESAGLIQPGNQAVVAAKISRCDKRPVCYDLLIRGAAPAGRSERGAFDDATGCSSRQSGVQLTTERGAGAAPNPSVNHPEPVKDNLELSPARRVFEHWKAVMRKPTAKLTSDRETKIRARIAEGYTIEQLCDAIDGCRLSPYHQGENDDRRVYNDLELICRSGSKVDRFIEFKSSPPTSRGGHRVTDVPQQQNFEAI